MGTLSNLAFSHKMKGAHAKIKRRVAAGCCPCCQRSFQNLRRHMDSQHPDYSGDAT